MKAAFPALFAAILLTAPVRAADAPKPLFAGDSVLQLTITAPLETLTERRSDLTRRVDGHIVVDGTAGDVVPVSIGLRGKRRRDREVCIVPPLRLEFPRDLPANSVFAGQGRLKLVTHCRRGMQFQQHILLEYAAYRLMNALTDESFRVRLAMIDYREADDKPDIIRYGFLIEDVDDMARRVGKREHETVIPIPAAALDSAAAARLALFQEMIGNLDWSITTGPPGEHCCHNSRPIGPKGATTGLNPVPYDFDYSGLVDASYAVPPDGIYLATVRQRRYMGLCSHNAAVPAAAAGLKSRRDALLAMLETIPSLPTSAKERARTYLADYLDTMLEPAALADRVARQCRGSHISQGDLP